MSLSELGSSTKGKYVGPSAREWFLGLACTGLAATQIGSIMATVPPQTAMAYYYQRPGVVALHWMSVLVDLVLVVCVAGWIFRSASAGIWANVIGVACAIGIVLVWLELGIALKPDPTMNYLLPGLPFRPINNVGLVGASVFLGYLTLRMPSGTINPVPAVTTKMALWLGLFGMQWVLFESVAKRLS